MAAEAEGKPAPFASLASEFARAARAHEVHEAWLELAGRPVAVRVVGSRLAETLLRPFAHLHGRAHPEPDLTIEAWDAEAAGIEAAPDPDDDPALRVWPLHTGRFVATADGRMVGHERPGWRAWLDRDDRRIVARVPGAGSVTLTERARPFHVLLAAWLGDGGIQLLHAGLVGRGEGGVLIGGTSGAGKSTTALACHAAGFTYLADDNVALEETADGAFVGHSLYATACLEPGDLAAFPRLHHEITGEDKDLVLPDPARVGRKVQIQAIVLPRVTGSPATAARPATWAEAMRALAPSSLLFLPTPAARGVERIGRLAHSVPRWWLDLGERSTIPGAVDSLLDGAGVE